MRSIGELPRVRDRMTRVVATTHPEAPVMAAREVMRKRVLRHLPVVDQRGRLVGIVTDRDLRQVVFTPSVRPLGGKLPGRGRYEYGLPVPAIHDPWEDHGTGN